MLDIRKSDMTTLTKNICFLFFGFMVDRGVRFTSNQDTTSSFRILCCRFSLLHSVTITYYTK